MKLDNMEASGLSLAEYAEMVGRVADKLDALTYSIGMALPADTHVQAIKSLLPETVNQLREAYTGITGENPWSTHP